MGILRSLGGTTSLLRSGSLNILAVHYALKKWWFLVRHHSCSVVVLERITQARKHSSKGSILALKPRADVTRSPKEGYH